MRRNYPTWDMRARAKRGNRSGLPDRRAQSRSGNPARFWSSDAAWSWAGRDNRDISASGAHSTGGIA